MEPIATEPLKEWRAHRRVYAGFVLALLVLVASLWGSILTKVARSL